MLEKHLNSKNSALYKHLSQLKHALNKNLIQPNSLHPSPFVFLCGANKAAGGISARRHALNRFLKKESPESKTIIAEKFLEFLENSKKHQNLYDMERTLSNFADVIVIVLESYSAFTELGAFTTRSLRHKLFVVNDKAFEHQQSFINLGPINALKEQDAKAVSWYPMAADGIEHGDAIGDTFPALLEAIENRLPENEKLDKEKLMPVGTLNRWAFSFCHDVIFYSRRSNPRELVLIYKFLFGDADFEMLATYKALLVSLGLAKSDGGYISSTQTTPILKSPPNRAALQSAFVSARYHMERRA